jgi:hypothetical protein
MLIAHAVCLCLAISLSRGCPSTLIRRVCVQGIIGSKGFGRTKSVLVSTTSKLEKHIKALEAELAAAQSLAVDPAEKVGGAVCGGSEVVMVLFGGAWCCVVRVLYDMVSHGVAWCSETCSGVAIAPTGRS